MVQVAAMPSQGSSGPRARWHALKGRLAPRGAQATPFLFLSASASWQSPIYSRATTTSRGPICKVPFGLCKPHVCCATRRIFAARARMIAPNADPAAAASRPSRRLRIVLPQPFSPANLRPASTWSSSSVHVRCVRCLYRCCADVRRSLRQPFTPCIRRARATTSRGEPRPLALAASWPPAYGCAVSPKLRATQTCARSIICPRRCACTSRRARTSRSAVGASSGCKRANAMIRTLFCTGR
jgi:hypothetical protein